MPTITIDIDNAGNLTRAVDAIAIKFNYQATLPGGGANPETKNQFGKRMVANWVKGIVADVEGQTASDAARATALASANAMGIT